MHSFDEFPTKISFPTSNHLSIPRHGDETIQLFNAASSNGLEVELAKTFE